MTDDNSGEATDDTGGVSNQISGGVFFHAVIQGRDITVRLPPKVTPALSGLPTPSATFAGRSQEVEELLKALAPAEAGQEAVLIHSVAGLAGVGKTELVLQVAAQAVRTAGWFPGGVLFIDMFGYDEQRRVSAERALDGLLGALGLPAEHVPAELQDRARLYRSVLAAFAEQGRRILVVVDNAATEDQARPLLPSDGHTSALITSRHTLDVGARLYDLDVLTAAASVDLMRQVLRRAHGPADVRVDDDLDAAGRIAALCGYLPLALRISAALLADAPSRPAASLAQALADAHRRLDQLKREDRAVRAAFDLSYQNLSDRQAQLFRLLPINPGPDVSTESVTHLADLDGTLTEIVLQDLARAHLIELGAVWGRWRLHDLVRLYANEHALARASDDGRESALTRLLNYYLSSAQGADTYVNPGADTVLSARFASQDEGFSWLEAERQNLVAAVVEAAREGNSAIAINLAAALTRFYDLRDYTGDWISTSTAVVALCRESGDRGNEGWALNSLGIALREARRFDEAIEVGTRAVEVVREAGDRYGEGQALGSLASALKEVRRFEESIDAGTRSIAINKEVGNVFGEAAGQANLGSTLRDMRRFDESIEAHRRAIALYGEIGDRRGEGLVLNNMGATLRLRGQFAEAVSAHTRAIALYQQTRDRGGEAGALNNLGSALGRMGQPEEAADAHARAAAIYKETGNRSSEGVAHNNLSIALQAMRRFDEAFDAHILAVSIAQETGDKLAEAMALSNLSNTYTEMRRFDEAITAHTRAVALFREADDKHGEAMALAGLGMTLRESGRVGEAIDKYARAVSLFRDMADSTNEATALKQLGEGFHEERRFSEAIDAHMRSAAVYRQLGDPGGEAAAFRNLANALREAGRTEESINATRRAAVRYQEAGDHHNAGAVLNNLTGELRAARRIEEAIDVLSLAASLFHQAAEPGSEAAAYYNLAETLCNAQRYAEAVDPFARAAALYREAGDLENEALSLMQFGVVSPLGRPSETIDAYARAAALFREIGDSDREAVALDALARARGRTE